MAEQKAQKAPAETAADPWQRTKRLLIFGGAGLGVVTAAWAVGRLQGHMGIRNANELTAAAEASASSARQAASAEQQTVLTLEARRRVHLADVEVERRNFGTANEHLQAAAKLLGRANAPGSELGKLADEMKNTSLVASADAAEAHKKLSDIARRIDALLPAITP